MIQGYPARVSVAPGESVVLHISTDAPRFRVCFYRWWDGAELVHCSAWIDGVSAPPRGAADDWHWPAYEFAIPLAWRSAVYVAHLDVDGGEAFHLSLSSAAILFVVRGRGRGKLLYKIPFATYHAYNYEGGGCYYDHPPRSAEPPGARVSLLRPGGGIGGRVWGAPDYYDDSSPRQTFAHWDAPFIRWLVQRGYDPDFCADLDIHADVTICSCYRLLLSVGHDEYWSEASRDHVESYVAAGGNLAFFAANVCWWRVHFVEDKTAMVCHQGGPQGARDHWWPVHGAGRPEDALAGVSYRHGGGWWDGPRDDGGYVVHAASHWVFEGTRLEPGDVLGQGTRPPLVGYECDGAPLQSCDRFPGALTLHASAATGATPENFIVLAAKGLNSRWQERPAREQGFSTAIHAATMGLYNAGGTVFTAGTTDWAQVLCTRQDARIERITLNVIDRLLAAKAQKSDVREKVLASALARLL